MNMTGTTLVGFIFHNLSKTEEATQAPQARASAREPDPRVMAHARHFHQRHLRWEEMKEKLRREEESEKKQQGGKKLPATSSP